jgi:hypothetical protein
MIFRRRIYAGLIMVTLLFCFAGFVSADSTNTTSQILSNIEEILKNNPIPAGQSTR